MQSEIRLSKANPPSTQEKKDLLSNYQYSQMIESLVHAHVNSKPNCAYTTNT